MVGCVAGVVDDVVCALVVDVRVVVCVVVGTGVSTTISSVPPARSISRSLLSSAALMILFSLYSPRGWCTSRTCSTKSETLLQLNGLRVHRGQ